MVRQVQTVRFRVPFLGYSGGAAMHNQNSFVHGGRRHHRGKHGMIWDGRREGSRRQVPGLAAKTEEDERRRTGKTMVDLTLNETF